MPPVSPRGWTIEGLLQQGPRFQAVPRCKADDPKLLQRIAAFESDGVPLIIEGWHTLDSWPKHMFTVDWLLKNGQQTISVRNVVDRTDTPLSLAEFIDHSRQMTAMNSEDASRKGPLYNKDAHCPPQWAEWVHAAGVLPERVCPGSQHDLFRYLTESEMVESLMCYLGIGGTFTPCHKDLCASSGQNLMCYTEGNGSSFWFMTESGDAPEATQYFQNHIGKELDWEDHTASVEDFAKAPFTVYIAEQELGDLVLVPPRSSHQVVNYGGLTVKTSWSRMTVAGLTTALYHELPLYRRVCRAEQYRVKHILYRALITMTDELKQLSQNNDGKEDKLQLYTTQLHDIVQLFDFVLGEEYTSRQVNLDTVPSSDRLTIKIPPIRQIRGSTIPQPNSSKQDNRDEIYHFACDFCGADIFQTFFECVRCQDRRAPEDKSSNALIICSSCYVEGRTCACENMQIKQCRRFIKLLEDRNLAAEVFNGAGAASQRLSLLNHEDIEKFSSVLLSEAAEKLLLRREDLKLKSKPAARQCRIKIGQSHPTHADCIVTCHVCHAGRCFGHLLEIGIHSSEAILRVQAGPKPNNAPDGQWHSRHNRSNDEFNEGAAALHEADRRGSVIPTFAHKLVALARNGACRPLNATYTKLGWYDVNPYVAIEDDMPQHGEADSAISSQEGDDSSQFDELDSDSSDPDFRASTSRRKPAPRRKSASTAMSKPTTASRGRPRLANAHASSSSSLTPLLSTGTGYISIGSGSASFFDDSYGVPSPTFSEDRRKDVTPVASMEKKRRFMSPRRAAEDEHAAKRRRDAASQSREASSSGLFRSTDRGFASQNHARSNEPPSDEHEKLHSSHLFQQRTIEQLLGQLTQARAVHREMAESVNRSIQDNVRIQEMEVEIAELKTRIGELEKNQRAFLNFAQQLKHKMEKPEYAIKEDVCKAIMEEIHDVLQPLVRLSVAGLIDEHMQAFYKAKDDPQPLLPQAQERPEDRLPRPRGYAPIQTLHNNNNERWTNEHSPNLSAANFDRPGVPYSYYGPPQGQFFNGPPPSHRQQPPFPQQPSNSMGFHNPNPNPGHQSRGGPFPPYQHRGGGPPPNNWPRTYGNSQRGRPYYQNDNRWPPPQLPPSRP